MTEPRWDEFLNVDWAAEWPLHEASWQHDLTWIEGGEHGEGRPDAAAEAQ